MKSVLFTLRTPDDQFVIFLMDTHSSFLNYTILPSDDYWVLADALIHNLTYNIPLPDEIYILGGTKDHVDNVNSQLEYYYIFIKIKQWENSDLSNEIRDLENFLRQNYPGTYGSFIKDQVRFFNIMKSPNSGMYQSPMEVLFGRPWTQNLNTTDEEPSIVKLFHHKMGRFAEEIYKKMWAEKMPNVKFE